ncbi:hypothetical protein SDC9_42724 [bioreactor metagenome]|uniref:HicB-like antitoxin of toxin-antitoxin system domain-containing protein n=1 Tax=bioreactor metagenome TaxID=1076179 RepID=A0A644W1E1_9ZZZZ|nr:hypothetical protein [Dehalococcoides mccartyi]
MKDPVMYITLTHKIHKEGRLWVGICEELGTSAYGRTVDEVEEQLTEAVCLHLNTLEDVQESERFFKENNIVVHHIKPRQEKVSITVDEASDGATFFRPYVQSIPVFAGC